MHIVTLPVEILVQVADFLPIKDKLSCTLVCKEWKDQFQQSLWRHIKINSIEKLDLISALAKRPTTEKPRNMMTQSIWFSDKYNVYEFLQLNIFQTFPNLRHLSIGSLTTLEKNTFLSNTTNQSRPFSDLRIRIPDSNWTLKTEDFMTILTNFPNLQSIDTDECDPMINLIFSFDDCNILYEKLPQLKSITAKFKPSDYYPIMQRSFSSIIPSLSITSFNNHVILDGTPEIYYSLFQYISCKYPNLRVLKFSTLTTSTDDSFRDGRRGRRSIQNRQEEQQPNIQSIEAAFQHLETVHFFGCEETPWVHSIFWNMVCCSRIPLKNIKYTCLDSLHQTYSTEIFFKQVLQAVSTTLKRFCFERRLAGHPTDIFIPDFGYCPRLINLEISGFNIYLEINNVLDNCTAIRRLKYSNGYLRIGANTHDKSKQHGLKELILDSVIAKSSVFNYISLRCRRLEYMSLTRTQIGGPISSEFESLSVDMSYTHFKRLEMHCVQFYSSEEEMNTNTAINMMLLSQLTTPVDPTENKADCDPISGVESIGLFHCLCKMSRFTCEAGIAQRQIKVFHDTPEYNQDCRFKESVVFGRENGPLYEYHMRNSLRIRLGKKFTEFKCGNIIKYNLPLLCNHKYSR